MNKGMKICGNLYVSPGLSRDLRYNMKAKKSKLESTWELWAHEKGGMTLHIVANSSRANQMDPVIGPTE